MHIALWVCAEPFARLSGDHNVKRKASCQTCFVTIDCESHASWCSSGKVCSCNMSMDGVEVMEQEYMVVSEVLEYQQVQGLHVDPTADHENDDFEEAPLSQEKLSCLGVGECGVSSRVTLTAAEADHILRMSRPTGNTSVPRETTLLHMLTIAISYLLIRFCLVCLCLCTTVQVSCDGC